MIKRFEKKTQVFRDIEISAQKQVKAYKDAAVFLRMSHKIQISHVNLDTIIDSSLHTLLKINIIMSVQE